MNGEDEIYLISIEHVIYSISNDLLIPLAEMLTALTRDLLLSLKKQQQY